MNPLFYCERTSYAGIASILGLGWPVQSCLCRICMVLVLAVQGLESRVIRLDVLSHKIWPAT